MDFFTPGVKSLLQKIGAVLLCLSVPAAIIRLAMIQASNIPLPHSGSSSGWFGPLEGAGDAIGYGATYLFDMGIGIAFAVVALILLAIFAFRTKSVWAFAGYPVAFVTLLFCVLPRHTEDLDLPAPVATYHGTPAPQVGVAKPPLAAASVSQPNGEDEAKQMFGPYWFQDGTLAPKSQREPKYEGGPLWPLTMLYAKDGVTVDQIKTFFSGQGVELKPAGPGFSGTFIRPGDNAEIHLVFGVAAGGDEAGKTVILYSPALKRS